MNVMFLNVSGNAVIAISRFNSISYFDFNPEAFQMLVRAVGEFISDIHHQRQMPQIYHVLKPTYLRH